MKLKDGLKLLNTVVTYTDSLSTQQTKDKYILAGITIRAKENALYYQAELIDIKQTNSLCIAKLSDVEAIE